MVADQINLVEASAALPDGWKTKTLGQTCSKITTGKLDANAMSEDGEYRFYTCAKNYFQTDSYAFDTEALLISGNGANVGYIHYYQGKFNAYQRTYVLSEFSDSIKFLQHVLAYKLAGRIRIEVNAGNTPYIVRGTLSDMSVTVPVSKIEQDKIAEALSDADALIESLEQLIAKKRLVKHGMVQSLLSGRQRIQDFGQNNGTRQSELGPIPVDWGISKLDALATMKSGQSITSEAIDYSSPFPCYGGNGLRGYAKRFTHEGQFALIGRQGALCGNVLGVSGKFFASEHAIVATPKSVTDIHWLTYVLSKMGLNRYSESSAQPGLSVSKLKNLPIAHPSLKSEQTAIASVIGSMDDELEPLEQKLQKLKEIKQGMMQELLTGRIRLI